MNKRGILGGVLMCWALAAPAQILVQRTIPYGDQAAVPQKVMTECTSLGSQFSDHIVKHGQALGMDVAAVDDPTLQPQSADTYADVRISNAMSMGNAFIGHAKGVGVKVALWHHGKIVAEEKFSRHSTGGIFGGFKSSCDVLDRTVDTLGKDIAAWLKKQNRTLQAAPANEAQ